MNLVLAAAALMAGKAHAQLKTGSSQKSGGQQAGGASVYQDPNAPKPLPPLGAPPSTQRQSTAESSNLKAAGDSLSPLTAEEIIALRKRLDNARRAAAKHPTVPPKPTISSLTVDLSPGATPPIVRVSNQGAAVSFVDVTGTPWDVLEVQNLAVERFDVQQPVKSIPTLTITAKGDYVEGNAAVFLKGLQIPVVVKMIAGQRETDYRLDLRIPRRGPNAVEPIRGETAINLSKSYMQSLLDGIDTPGAKEVRIQNAPVGTKAFLYDGKVILRTNLPLTNPSYFGSLAAADGTRVYEILRTPVVSVSENGALKNIYLDLEE